jgi:hypothetical protein
VFVIGMCGFVLGSELLVRYVVAPADDYDRYKALFRTARAPVATFGDSHVANAVENGPEVVNLGYPGESLWLMLYKARAYVEEGRGRRIVLQFSPEQFAIYRAEKDQQAVADDLSGRNESWLKFMRPHYRGYLLGYWNALLRNPGVLLSARAEPAASASDKVRSFASWPKDEQRRDAEIRVQLHAPLPQGRTIEALVAQFDSALREFRQRGVDTCIVEYPLSSVYRTAADRVPTFADMRGRIRRLADKEHVRYVDLTDAMADTDFADPDHVAPGYRDTATRLVLDRCFPGAGGAR